MMELFLSALIWAIILVDALTIFVARRYHQRQLQARYLEGVQDGAAQNIEWARKDAVARYKMELHRKLVDSGRSSMARPGAEPARIHRLRVGRPQPPRTPESD